MGTREFFCVHRFSSTTLSWQNHTPGQLSIWILITQQSDVHEKVAKSCVGSPPSLRFTARRHLIPSLWKTGEKRDFLALFTAPRQVFVISQIREREMNLRILSQLFRISLCCVINSQILNCPGGCFDFCQERVCVCNLVFLSRYMRPEGP